MRTVTVEEELADEGKKMWSNISNYEKLANGKSLLGRPKPLPKVNMFEVELIFVRTEIRRMIRNSERVIQDCEEIIRKLRTKEEYFSSEAKVAMQVHKNLIERLKRILESQNAFDHHIYVDDEPDRPYKEKKDGRKISDK